MRQGTSEGLRHERGSYTYLHLDLDTRGTYEVASTEGDCLASQSHRTYCGQYMASNDHTTVHPVHGLQLWTMTRIMTMTAIIDESKDQKEHRHEDQDELRGIDIAEWD